jgi:hypothetical protein
MMAVQLNRSPDTPSTAGRARTGWTPGRVVSVLIGGVLALSSIGLITAGGYAWNAASGNGGWLNLGHAAYATESYAVVTEPEDWGSETYLLGDVEKVRIRVTPADATTPVFLGMGRPDDVERYLSGIAHVVAHDASGNDVAYTEHDGQAPAGPPAGAIPWTAQSLGAGVQTLEFAAKAQHGDRVLVAMNADGSPVVNGKVESLVTQPSLSWIAGGMLAGGVAAGAGAAFLLVRPVWRASGRR